MAEKRVAYKEVNTFGFCSLPIGVADITKILFLQDLVSFGVPSTPKMLFPRFSLSTYIVQSCGEKACHVKKFIVLYSNMQTGNFTEGGRGRNASPLQKKNARR